MASSTLDRQLLEELFTEISSQPDGVSAARFRAKHEDHLGDIDALVNSGLIERRDNLYWPRLEAIAELKSSNSRAESLLYLCSHLFQVLRKLYKEDPERRLTITALAQAADQPHDLIRRALRYLIHAPIWGGYSGDFSAADAYVMPGETILRYKSLDDWIDQQRQLTAAKNAAITSPIFQSDVAEPPHSKSQRKYQIFISSTFTDLQLERQAAVEGVLLAGHIPAGMELFSAGSESQLEVIREWIHESDIFMLILGNRYGSIEPKSQLSYTELEYDHAMSLGKPLFALVLSDKAIGAKLEADPDSNVEKANVDKHAKFKEKVLSRISAFVEDEKDIKINTMKSIQSIANKYRPMGWVRAIDPDRGS
jgi:hypothetical protein